MILISTSISSYFNIGTFLNVSTLSLNWYVTLLIQISKSFDFSPKLISLSIRDWSSITGRSGAGATKREGGGGK